jgi:hypothetical protein
MSVTTSHAPRRASTSVLCVAALLAGVACANTASAQALPAANTKANTGAWALDGNTGMPAGFFLGIADAADVRPLTMRAANRQVARFDGVSAATVNVTLGAAANGFAASVRGATVGGGGSNGTDGVAGGGGNLVGYHYGTVGGGHGNVAGQNAANGSHAMVGGGLANRALGHAAAIAGGSHNEATSSYATVSGGYFNRATAPTSTIAGGEDNVAAAGGSTVSGGWTNEALAMGASVAGGERNCAGGEYAWAGGFRAKVRPALNPGATSIACAGLTYPGGRGDAGTFVWADSRDANFTSSGSDQFLLRAQGGVGINTAPLQHTVELTVQTDADGIGDYANLWLKQKAASNNGVLISVGDGSGANNAGFYVDHYNGSTQMRRMELAPNGSVTIRSNTTQSASGVTLAPGSGAWSSLSDRRLKTAIAAVDPVSILDRLVATPIATWSYRAQSDVRHIGPMAQDFAAAFGVGENDTTISTIDADGVALAAIQGLNAKLEHENAVLREALESQRTRLESVSRRLERLEAQR